MHARDHIKLEPFRLLSKNQPPPKSAPPHTHPPYCCHCCHCCHCSFQHWLPEQKCFQPFFSLSFVFALMPFPDSFIFPRLFCLFLWAKPSHSGDVARRRMTRDPPLLSEYSKGKCKNCWKGDFGYKPNFSFSFQQQEEGKRKGFQAVFFRIFSHTQSKSRQNRRTVKLVGT